jgi:hypothetical protein
MVFIAVLSFFRPFFPDRKTAFVFSGLSIVERKTENTIPATAPVVEYRPTSAAHDHRQPAMTDRPDPDPPRPTLDDLDPENATTDRLIAMVRGHREGETYPKLEAPWNGKPD